MPDPAAATDPVLVTVLGQLGQVGLVLVAAFIAWLKLGKPTNNGKTIHVRADGSPLDRANLQTEATVAELGKAVPRMVTILEDHTALFKSTHDLQGESVRALRQLLERDDQARAERRKLIRECEALPNEINRLLRGDFRDPRPTTGPVQRVEP